DKKIKIYPNPVSGILHIEGVWAGAIIELVDILGRRRTGSSPYPPQGETHIVDVSTLVPGVYMVRVNGVVVGRVVKE
ncbi:MAG TPA: T9SS type A sorting domain-containing protein, partial [Flavipsychrobacter sp.]